jgi:hypothetical protein
VQNVISGKMYSNRDEQKGRVPLPNRQHLKNHQNGTYRKNARNLEMMAGR